MADDDAVPGANIAVQTYGDFLNFNPHLHAAIVSGSCFSKDGDFHMAPGSMPEDSDVPWPGLAAPAETSVFDSAVTFSRPGFDSLKAAYSEIYSLKRVAASLSGPG
ncbi:MAG: hypothetical protein MI862_27065 [Desulfobacterales bacterium]|nr:hypothetical protein [Desulfobacterales bacterium]